MQIQAVLCQLLCLTSYEQPASKMQAKKGSWNLAFWLV